MTAKKVLQYRHQINRIKEPAPLWIIGSVGLHLKRTPTWREAFHGGLLVEPHMPELNEFKKYFVGALRVRLFPGMRGAVLKLLCGLFISSCPTAFQCKRSKALYRSLQCDQIGQFCILGYFESQISAIMADSGALLSAEIGKCHTVAKCVNTFSTFC